MELAKTACSRCKNNQWLNFRTAEPPQGSHVGKNQRKACYAFEDRDREFGLI